MRVKLSSIDEINKILRKEIIFQSELEERRVVNGYSIHGQDLVTQLNSYLQNSYDPKDSYIVYELHVDGDYTTETDFSGVLTIAAKYKMHLYVYGNNSTTLSNVLVSRLETDECRLHLQNEGINLISISNISNGTDFINETLYPRTDLDINIYSELQILPKSNDIINTINDIKLEIINSEENING